MNSKYALDENLTSWNNLYHFKIDLYQLSFNRKTAPKITNSKIQSPTNTIPQVIPTYDLAILFEAIRSNPKQSEAIKRNQKERHATWYWLAGWSNSQGRIKTSSFLITKFKYCLGLTILMVWKTINFNFLFEEFVIMVIRFGNGSTCNCL